MGKTYRIDSMIRDLGLDLAVAMPAKVYVRGRGLDSEWAGDLKVAGSAL